MKFNGSNENVIKGIFLTLQNSNHNKFYKMEKDKIDSSTFSVRYGRIGTNGTKVEYPIWNWNKVLQSKIKKGYSVKREEYFSKSIIEEKQSKLSDDKFEQISAKIDFLLDLVNDAKYDPKFNNNLIDVIHDINWVDDIKVKFNKTKIIDVVSLTTLNDIYKKYKELI